MGADTKTNTLSGSGAREHGDLRLLEDGSKGGGALDPDVVIIEPARNQGWESLGR